MRSAVFAGLAAAAVVSSVIAQDSIVTVTVTECGSTTSEPSGPAPTDSTSTDTATSLPSGTGTGTPPVASQELNDLAKAAGKLYFGTASDIPPVDDQGAELYDEAYMTLLNDTHMFGQRTPANIQKVNHSDD